MLTLMTGIFLKTLRAVGFTQVSKSADTHEREIKHREFAKKLICMRLQTSVN